MSLDYLLNLFQWRKELKRSQEKTTGKRKTDTKEPQGTRCEKVLQGEFK